MCDYYRAFLLVVNSASRRRRLEERGAAFNSLAQSQLECGQFLFINFYQLLVLIAFNDKLDVSVSLCAQVQMTPIEFISCSHTTPRAYSPPGYCNLERLLRRSIRLITIVAVSSSIGQGMYDSRRFLKEAARYSYKVTNCDCLFEPRPEPVHRLVDLICRLLNWVRIG